MSTDRELLELAAKAADMFITPEKLKKHLPGWEWEDSFEPYFTEGGGICGTVIWHSGKGELGGTEEMVWNPLNDDGDALRLAASLFMSVRLDVGETIVSTVESLKRGFFVIEQNKKQDRCYAARRAIVRFAAEIGRAMK